jgi:hypothetical protein
MEANDPGPSVRILSPQRIRPDGIGPARLPLNLHRGAQREISSAPAVYRRPDHATSVLTAATTPTNTVATRAILITMAKRRVTHVVFRPDHLILSLAFLSTNLLASPDRLVRRVFALKRRGVFPSASRMYLG